MVFWVPAEDDGWRLRVGVLAGVRADEEDLSPMMPTVSGT